MHTLLIIGFIIKGLYFPTISTPVSNVTTDRPGYVNINYWGGGTMVYAHDYLAGVNFPDATTVTAIFEDGSTTSYTLSETFVLEDLNLWNFAITDMPSKDSMTFATCHGSGRLLMQFYEDEEDPLWR